MNTVPARGTMSVRLVRLAHDALSLVVLLILVFNPVLTAAAAPARSYAAQPAPGSTPNIPGNPGVMPNTPADPGSTPATFDDLPPLVQAAYSEVVGEDNDTFHVLSDGQGGWQAAAPGHNFSSAFSSDGLRLQSGDDTLQLSLRQYGYGEHLSDIPTAAPQVSGNRVFYRRVVDHEDEPLLTEWYINGPLGLEQGFTLASPPPSNSPLGGTEGGPLTLALNLSGSLRARLDADGRSLRLTRPDGSHALNYSGLLAYDVTGQELPAWLELDTSGTHLLLRVEDAGAAYPLTIDPWLQMAKLLASDSTNNSNIGYSVAVSGDTIVVGAGYSNPNAVYVFEKPAGGWSGTLNQSARLQASDGGGGGLGISVAVDGDTVVVGANAYDGHTGAAYVFEKPGGGWSGTLNESAKLQASDGESGEQFGYSVAIDGDTVVVGALQGEYNGLADGLAFVFVEPGGGWSGTLNQSATLLPTVTGSRFGHSVAVDGDTVVVGMTWDNENGSSATGSAFIFERPGGGWSGTLSHSAKLVPSDLEGNNEMGNSVAIQGDTVVVGAHQAHNGSGEQTGAVYIFERPGGGWSGTLSHTAKLQPSDATPGNYIGCSVDIDGDTIMIGARQDDDNGTDSGSVYVYTYDGWSWSYSDELFPSDGADLDYFGNSVAVDGYTLVVGAPYDDDYGSGSGSAYAFQANTLSVFKDGPGDGDVTSDDFEIDCGSICSAEYSLNEEVILSASPGIGWDFAGWSGACTALSGDCTVTMSSPQEVTATFSLFYELEVIVNGSNLGVITSSTPPGLNCASDFCFQDFVSGTLVSLHATPVPTASFVGWEGPCSGNGACDVLLDANQSVSATFKLATTTAISSHLPNPSVVGQSVLVSYTVSAVEGGPPSGMVTIATEGDPAACSGPAPVGTCVLTPTLSGTRAFTATYSGDEFLSPSWITASHTISKAATSLSLVSDEPDPTVTGQPFTATFDLAVALPGSGSPSGDVSVDDGAGASCVGPVAQGYCVLTPTLAGPKVITLTYPGDANFDGSVVTGSHQVNLADTQPTITAITPQGGLPGEDSLPNQALDIDFTVVVSPPGSGTPSGTLNLLDSDGNTCSGSAPTDACSITPLLAGPKVITLTYSGDANYNGSVVTSSHTVLKAPTLITITGDAPDNALRHVPVTVSYTVAAEFAWTGTPTGVVEVSLWHDIAACSGPAPTGSCVLTPTLAQGTLVVAEYQGNHNFQTSTDLEAHVVLGPSDYSVITLTADLPDPSVVGQPVVVSYTVAPTATIAYSMTGEVIVLDDNGNVCVGDVHDESCTLLPSKRGPKTLVAVYSGNERLNGSQTSEPHQVDRAGTSTAISAHLPDPSIMGQPVEVFFQVSANPPGGGSPTGFVNVDDGEGNTCISRAEYGSCVLVPTQPGPKTLTASYVGDSLRYDTSQGSAAHLVYDIPIAGLAAQVGQVYLGQASTFDAAITAGTNVVYRWDFGDGSLPITTTQTQISHTYGLIGTYTTTLMAENLGSAAATTAQAVVVDVPIAGLSAQANTDAVLLGETVHFTATVSAGSNVAYTWDFGDGSPTAWGQYAQHVYADLGVYTPRVTAVNGTSNASADGAPVSIVSQITGLTANSSSPTPITQLTVFNTSIASGVGVEYHWDFGDGSPPLVTPDQLVIYTYPVGGNYSAVVTATNGASQQNVTLPVAIIDDDIVGLSAVSSDPTAIDTPTTFTATVLAGSSVVYTWDFGDGSPTVQGQVVQHTYDPPGTPELTLYDATVTASNAQGQMLATTQVNVYLTPPQTRQIRAVSLTAQRFHEMGDGRTRATGMISFDGGRLRLNGADAILYYISSALHFTGTLELRTSTQAMTLGTGEFMALTSNGWTLPQGELSDTFTQLSGFDVSGVDVDRVRLADAQVKGSASTMHLDVQGVSATGSVSDFTLDVQGNSIATSGALDPLSFGMAGAQVNVRGMQLENYGVSSTRPARLTMPASLGGRTANATNLHLTPNQISLDPVSLSSLRGSTMRVSNATAQLLPAPGGGLQFGIDGTLRLMLPQNRDTLPLSGALQANGEFSANLTRVYINAASFILVANNVPIESLDDNIVADTAIVQLPWELGGVSFSVSNVELNPDGLFFSGQNSFDLSDFSMADGAFSLHGAGASVYPAGSGLEVQVTAQLELHIPGALDMSDITLTIAPSGRLGGEIGDLSVQLAFFNLNIVEGGIRPDGSLYASEATLNIPATAEGFSGDFSVSVYNIVISGDGVEVGGGSFALPDMNFGSFELVDMGGSLMRTATGYDVSAQGGFKLASIPGQQGGGCSGIWVAVTLSVDVNGNAVINIMPVSQAPQGVQGIGNIRLKEAQLKVFCRIPIGNTGFYITEIRGSINLAPGETRISLGMTVEGGAKIGPIDAPISADADITLDFQPLKLALIGTVKVFAVTVGGAEAELTRNSFYAKLWVDLVYAEGNFTVRAWSDHRGFSFTASARATFRLRKGFISSTCAWGLCINIPPWSITLGSIGVDGGRFSNDAWGFKAYVEVFGNQYGVYIDHKLNISFGSVDEYHLMTPLTVAAARRAMALHSLDSYNGLTIKPNGDIIQDVELGAADSATFSLAGNGERPQLSLIDPHGVVISPTNLPANVDFYEVSDYTIQDSAATSGTVQLRLVHAAPGAAPVNVVISGTHANTTTTELTCFYNQAFGDISGYEPIVPGTAWVSIVRASDSAILLDNVAVQLEPLADYSLALVEEDGTLALKQVSDIKPLAVEDEALVRLVNLWPTTNTLALHHPGGMQLAEDITYTQASDYVFVPGGTSNLVVYDSETMDELAVASNDATRNEHLYSVFVLPPPAGESAPQALLHRDTTSSARLRFINAGPDRNALDLSIDSQSALFEDVLYGEATPYTYVDSGLYTATLDSTQVTHTLDLEHGQDYSLIAANDGGTPILLLLTDDNNSIPSIGTSRLRLVNVAITESLKLSIVDGPLLFADVGHNSASDYVNIAGGTHWLDLWTTGGEWQLILPDAQLRDGQVYSIVAFVQPDGDVELVVLTDLATAKTVQTMYVVGQPEQGKWQAVLSGDPGPDDVYIFSVIGTSPAPHLTDVAVAHNPGDEQARLNWRLSTDEPDTRLGMYVNSGPLTYTEVITDPNTGISQTVAITNYTGPALAYDLTLTDTKWITNTALQTYTADVSGLPSGEYRVWVDVDDGRNPPVRVYASEVVSIPARPWDSAWDDAIITATTGMRSISVEWEAHPDPDVSDYALEANGPTISGTRVMSVGLFREAMLTNLDPNEVYSLTLLAQNGPSGQIARSQAFMVTPQGAPMTLSALGDTTLSLEIGQSAELALLLSTPLDEYPEPVGLMAGALPAGLDLDLPLELFIPRIEGSALPTIISAYITATENITHGTYLVSIVAQGIGSNSELVLTVDVVGQELSVNLPGSGNGSVSSELPGIDCGTDCAEIYNSGTVVTLTAEVGQDSIFAGWSGDVASTDNPLQLTMDSAMAINALFAYEDITYTLDVNIVGNGEVKRLLDSMVYLSGTEVLLTALPEASWYFGGWSGDLGGADNPAALTMDSSKVVTATFTTEPVPTYTLTVDVVGMGAVSKSPDASVYISGTQVLLTATPEAGWAFAGWSGDWDGMDNPATLTMDSDKIVTATFTTEPPRHYMYLVLITKYYGH